MIGCDVSIDPLLLACPSPDALLASLQNDECPTEWFHLGCAGLTAEPTGKWFCTDCVPKKKKR